MLVSENHRFDRKFIKSLKPGTYSAVYPNPDAKAKSPYKICVFDAPGCTEESDFLAQALVDNLYTTTCCYLEKQDEILLHCANRIINNGIDEVKCYVLEGEVMEHIWLVYSMLTLDAKK